MFENLPLDQMNENDVGEEIIRPLAKRLGYALGTPATIITEKTLRYDRHYLGRKDPKKDPKIQGRVDYICEYTTFGRFVIEAKHPNIELTLEESQQAHTYAAHPEIAAFYYILTNGRLFRLYRTGNPDKPIFEWALGDTEKYILLLENLLSPEAIKKVSYVPLDISQPLARGYGSRIRVVGGVLDYDKHECDDPLLNSHMQSSPTSASVIEGIVERDGDSKIVGTVEVAGPYSMIDELNRLAGRNTYSFKTSDEFISNKEDKPTIFQNFAELIVPAGIAVPSSSFMGLDRLPFGIEMKAYTNAVGYIEGDRFVGVMEIDYDIKLKLSVAMARVIPIRQEFKMRGCGQFDLIIANTPAG